MFIAIDRPFFGELLLNSDYIVEMRATSVKLNDQTHKVTRIVMSDGKEHDAFETLPVIRNRLS